MSMARAVPEDGQDRVVETSEEDARHHLQERVSRCRIGGSRGPTVRRHVKESYPKPTKVGSRESVTADGRTLFQELGKMTLHLR